MITLSNSVHKAKKVHKCNFCGLPIEIGETYNRQANIQDGDFFEWKSHKSCEAIAYELNMFNNCEDGVDEYSFSEDIKNEYQDIMSNSYTEIYESKDFKYPSFKEQLEFVKKHKLIK